MSRLQYASRCSKGTLATKIGWIDFGSDFTYNLAGSPVQVVNTIPGGFTVQFNLTISNTVATPQGVSIPTFISSRIPAVNQAPFGTVYDTGIGGYPALTLQNATSAGTNLVYMIYLTDIEVLDWNGNNISDYTMYIADAGITNIVTTGTPNTWQIRTDGGPFGITQQIPSYSGATTGPTVVGENSQILTEVGTETGATTTASYVYSTTSPETITGMNTLFSGTAAWAFGIIVNQKVNCLKLADGCCKCANIIQGVTANYFILPDDVRLQKVELNGTSYTIGEKPVTVTGSQAVYQISKKYIIATALASPTGTRDVFHIMYQNGSSCDCNYGLCCSAVIFQA